MSPDSLLLPKSPAFASARPKGKTPHLTWGAATSTERGPIVATLRNRQYRNVIGAHSGPYSVYRALAIASGALSADHIPDLTNTAPTDRIGPHPQWSNSSRIVSLDPWGHLIGEQFCDYLAAGYDVRPTIAITRAHLDIPEIRQAISCGDIPIDEAVVTRGNTVRVTKIAIEPVWHLPGIAKRFGIPENDLRRGLHEHTAGMYPDLITRSDLEVFLPPIGGTTVYCFGDVTKLGCNTTRIACRVHDECNGSDVFGSDICSCRPYLAHGVALCIEMAQAGGVGLVIYNRKEGRALGEVTKFLVYNARKRQSGGDRPDAYFRRTECVAGVQDMRFQDLMPDVLHWLGVKHIDRFASMSDMKYDALARQDISIAERVPLPFEKIPDEARVEIEAKMATGYFSVEEQPFVPSETVGRTLTE